MKKNVPDTHNIQIHQATHIQGQMYDPRHVLKSWSHSTLESIDLSEKDRLFNEGLYQVTKFFPIHMSQLLTSRVFLQEINKGHHHIASFFFSFFFSSAEDCSKFPQGPPHLCTVHGTAKTPRLAPQRDSSKKRDPVSKSYLQRHGQQLGVGGGTMVV